MHEAAINLFQLLVQAGAVPGRDFSCDKANQGFRLSERGLQLLTEAYPEVDWHDILLPADQTPIADQLQQLLGVSFVEQLLAFMQGRLKDLPDSQAAWYLRQIVIGVEERTELALLPLLQERLDLAGQARLEWLLRLPDEAIETCEDWIHDVILAAGGSAEDFEVSDQCEVWLTESGFERLSLVWQGQCTLQVVRR